MQHEKYMRALESLREGTSLDVLGQVLTDLLVRISDTDLLHYCHLISLNLHVSKLHFTDLPKVAVEGLL
jgi:hypothetical protein